MSIRASTVTLKQPTMLRPVRLIVRVPKAQHAAMASKKALKHAMTETPTMVMAATTTVPKPHAATVSRQAAKLAMTETPMTLMHVPTTVLRRYAVTGCGAQTFKTPKQPALKAATMETLRMQTTAQTIAKWPNAEMVLSEPISQKVYLAMSSVTTAILRVEMDAPATAWTPMVLSVEMALLKETKPVT